MPANFRNVRAHFESLAELVGYVVLRSEAERAAAHLDGLMVWGSDAIEVARAELAEPQVAESVTAAVAVAMALRVTDLYPLVVERFCGDAADVRNAARIGLRLGDVGSIVRSLEAAASGGSLATRIALLDVAAFHRRRPPCEPAELMACQEPESRAILVEALGRLGDPSLVLRFESDSDPAVRRLFWRSLARAGDSAIASRCRQQIAQDRPCHDAIRCLGVVGSAQDVPALVKLAQDESTALPAIEALGILGACEVVPHLVDMLSGPHSAQTAAESLERITGRTVPRGDPLPPPEHLSDDERDFWFHPGDPIVDAVQQWWDQNRASFEPGKRYQAGICVSDDPLGAVFDQLPDDVRRDVYLRERALRSTTTPDWELETWPKYQRDPGWAGRGHRGA